MSPNVSKRFPLLGFQCGKSVVPSHIGIGSRSVSSHIASLHLFCSINHRSTTLQILPSKRGGKILLLVMPSKAPLGFPFVKPSSRRTSSTSRRSRSLSTNSHVSHRSLSRSVRSTSSSNTTRDRPASQSEVRVHIPNQRNTVPAPTASESVTGSEANDADQDTLNEVIMAVDLKEQGTVGCCYYVARDERLFLMEDVKLGGIDVVDACK